MRLLLFYYFLSPPSNLALSLVSRPGGGENDVWAALQPRACDDAVATSPTRAKLQSREVCVIILKPKCASPAASIVGNSALSRSHFSVNFCLECYIYTLVMMNGVIIFGCCSGITVAILTEPKLHPPRVRVDVSSPRVLHRDPFGIRSSYSRCYCVLLQKLK